MELKDMTIDELEARKVAIVAELDNEGADLDALEAEGRAINAELEDRKAVEAQKAEIREQVAQGDVGEVIESIPEERKETMDVNEIRNSAEYINAYAEYIKTGDAKEVRALITENATNGTVAVPELVYEIVKNAWEKEGIMSLVKKSYLRGNLKVGFEISASGATVHNEAASLDEENLVLGIVELVPKSIKKWISVSDEALDLRGEAFLRYIYDELAYQIAKKAADELIAKINACGTVSTTTCPSVQKITSTTISVGLIAQAMGQLSDQAANPVVIMNKATWAEFKKAQADNNFNYDPFEGLPVVFNNTITSFAAATTGVTYAIVGDLAQGALANFPNGEEITMKYDDLSLAEKDLVKIVGRQFVGLGVIAPDAFVKIVH